MNIKGAFEVLNEIVRAESGVVSGGTAEGGHFAVGERGEAFAPWGGSGLVA